MLAEGRYIEGGAEAYAGRMLARNLGVSVGDQIVVLGTASNGGVAALAVTLVGTFASGIAELDRQLLEVPYAPVAEAFEMHDAAHAIVVRAESVAARSRRRRRCCARIFRRTRSCSNGRRCCLICSRRSCSIVRPAT